MNKYCISFIGSIIPVCGGGGEGICNYMNAGWLKRTKAFRISDQKDYNKAIRPGLWISILTELLFKNEV